MASVADICNMALSHVGSSTEVVSISPPDGSVEAGLCARFYPIARKEALESHRWTWCKKRALLAPTTNPSEVWTYAYALPSDCISAARVLQKASVFDFVWWSFVLPVTADEYKLWTERGSADFEIEDGVLLTHEPDAVLLYTRDVTDTTKFSATFTSFLSYLLASYLSGPIIKGDAGAKAALQWRQIAARVKGEAASDDANDSSERNDFVPSNIRAR